MVFKWEEAGETCLRWSISKDLGDVKELPGDHLPGDQKKECSRQRQKPVSGQGRLAFVCLEESKQARVAATD